MKTMVVTIYLLVCGAVGNQIIELVGKMEDPRIIRSNPVDEIHLDAPAPEDQ